MTILAVAGILCFAGVIWLRVREDFHGAHRTMERRTAFGDVFFLVVRERGPLAGGIVIPDDVEGMASKGLSQHFADVLKQLPRGRYAYEVEPASRRFVVSGPEGLQLRGFVPQDQTLPPGRSQADSH